VFTSQIEEGAYTLDVSTAQDLAGNVMYPAEDVHALTFDAISPQVQSVFPSDGARAVTVDASIVISFSEPISTSTFAYTVSPDPGGWDEIWDVSKEAVTLLHNDFVTGTTYTVTMAEASDLVGHPLDGAPLTWSFTTTAAHQVYLPLALRSVGP
jgi:hypothetical protein